MSYDDPKTQPKVGPSERVIYDQADIKITNLRAVFGAKTYSISNITSVEAQKIEPSGCLVGGLMLLGFPMIFFSILSLIDGNSESWGVLIMGVLFAGAGLAGYRAQKPSYAVKLTTAAGEVKACTSDDESSIREIVEALNNAIIQKG